MLSSVFDPDRSPVDEFFFGQICRSTPAEARDLAAQLPADQQARLALFCNARSHLREQGRAIASICDVDILIRVGALAGQILADQVAAGPPSWDRPSFRQRPPISLAHN